MEQRHLSITAFSDELQISRTALQDYLKGTGNPRVETVEYLAKRLNIEPVTLVSGIFNPTQMDILLHLFKSFEFVDKLSEDKQNQLVSFILEVIDLWGSNE